MTHSVSGMVASLLLLGCHLVSAQEKTELVERWLKPGEVVLSGVRVFAEPKRAHEILKNVTLSVTFPNRDDGEILKNVALSVTFANRDDGTDENDFLREGRLVQGQGIVWCPFRSSGPPKHQFSGHWQLSAAGDLSIRGKHEPANGATELPPNLQDLGELRFVSARIWLREGPRPGDYSVGIELARVKDGDTVVPEKKER